MTQAELNIPEMIVDAINAGACHREIEEICRVYAEKGLSGVINDARAPYWARWYSTQVKGYPMPELEPIILRGMGESLKYAHFFGERWPALEAKLLEKCAENVKAGTSTYLHKSIRYALLVDMKSWPELEKYVAKDGGAALEYARFILQDRFEKGEPAIFESKLNSEDYDLKEKYLKLLRALGYNVDQLFPE